MRSALCLAVLAACSTAPVQTEPSRFDPQTPVDPAPPPPSPAAVRQRTFLADTLRRPAPLLPGLDTPSPFDYSPEPRRIAATCWYLSKAIMLAAAASYFFSPTPSGGWAVKILPHRWQRNFCKR